MLAIVTLLIMLLLVVVCVWAHFEPSMQDLCEVLKTIATGAIGVSVATYILAEAVRRGRYR